MARTRRIQADYQSSSLAPYFWPNARAELERHSGASKVQRCARARRNQTVAQWTEGAQLASDETLAQSCPIGFER